MTRPIVILDIETIPDLANWQPKDETKDEFPPQWAHVPIVIGTIVLQGGAVSIEPYTVDVNSPTPEKTILQRWNERMNELRPLIVTWWGRNFDLPVLNLRSLRHGVPMAWYYAQNYRYRYGEDQHVDLCDLLSEFGAVKSMKLDLIGKLIGLPGKHGVDGSQVKTLFAEGRLQEIEDYCVTDIVQTAAVYLRWRLLKNKITAAAYGNGITALLSALGARPRNESFLEAIDTNRLLLTETEVPLPRPKSK